ncbi:MAG: aminodeoxychorismate/anthranilate synthase component II [Nitriliruptoraceae bacterium]
MREPVRILLVDNYDSFTYNVAQQLGQLGAEVTVVRNDEFDVTAVVADPPDGIVISPGPGTPSDTGASNDLIRALAGDRPILGVCLGHQCIGEVFGGRIVVAPTLVHGKTSPIHHHGTGLFEGLPSPFDATRYHSLVVDSTFLPDVIEVTATTDDGLIMGLRHRELDIEGVQFHPESVLTIDGPALLANFVERCRSRREERQDGLPASAAEE